MAFKVLAINPGSTSTKMAVFEDENQIFTKTIRHSAEEIARFPTIFSQFKYRKEILLNELWEAGIALSDINAIVGRGGLVRPIESGTYEVNEDMLHDLEQAAMGEHASNLGGLIAHDLVSTLHNGAKAYIADPVVVDELEPLARVSGHPAFPRVSIFHALNQKAIARLYAKEAGKKYEELNLIVVHLGGGISVSAHRQGRVIDTNNALDGDGPFSPERSGGLPAGSLAKLCFSGKKSLPEVKKMLCGAGGLVAYLGSNDTLEIGKKAAIDAEWKLYMDAMAYQVAKEIGAMAAVLKGQVDAILLTGGIAYSQPITTLITESIQFIAPVKIYPGEDELRALAMNGLSILRNETQPRVY